MKKLLLGLLICLGVSGVLVSVGSATPCVSAQQTITETQLPEESYESNYFREKIMPFITANISAIGTAIGAVLLCMGKIKKATNALIDSTAESLNLKKKNKHLQEEIVKLKQDINDCKEELTKIYKTSDKTKEMVKIGFCNTTELVANGYAEQIAEIAKEVNNEDQNQQ